MNGLYAPNYLPHITMTKMQNEKNAKKQGVETNNFISKDKMKWTLHPQIEIM